MQAKGGTHFISLGVPPEGSGYSLQVLAALRAFRCYPSRKLRFHKKNRII